MATNSPNLAQQLELLKGRLELIEGQHDAFGEHERQLCDLIDAAIVGSHDNGSHGPTTTGLSAGRRKEFVPSTFVFGTVRNPVQGVPAISPVYGEERKRLLNDLATTYVDHLSTRSRIQ